MPRSRVQRLHSVRIASPVCVVEAAAAPSDLVSAVSAKPNQAINADPNGVSSKTTLRWRGMSQLHGTAMIPAAQHWMFDRAPREYCDIALSFLAD